MPQRVIWIDFAKVVAAFCVVLIHVAAPEILRQEFDSSSWQVANLLDSFSRFAPPVFFMISGAMLLGKSESIGSFFTKRASKLFVPFLFWSLLFLAYKKLLVPSMTTSQLFFDLVSGDAFFHLWFVNAILILYILTPLLRKAIARWKAKYLIIGVAGLFATSAYGILEIKQYLFLFKSLGHIAFFVTGYLLLAVNIPKSVSLPTLSIAALVTAYLTYTLSVEADALDLSFYEYTSPNVIILSIFVYLALKTFDTGSHRARSWMVNVSNLTLGIYLIHPLFLGLVKLAWLYEMNFVAGLILDTLIVLGLSFGSVKIISKIPYLSKTV